MEYLTLGRTCLRASVIGLGAGGASRLGLGTGRSDADAVALVRHEPGVHVVLSGTGDPAHLEANVRSALRPPLSPAHRARLAALFGRVVGGPGN